MSRYELIYFSSSLKKRSKDSWREKIEDIDGEIVEPILKDGYTRGLIIDTGNTNG